MVNRKAPARAEMMFLAYSLMGANRSLKGLSEIAVKMGAPVSRNTLERYSARFGWQDRVDAFDKEAQAETQHALIRTVADMNEGQAVAGHAFQAWAMENAAALRATGERLEVKDIVAVYRAGVDSERNALGEPTSRTEHTIVSINAMVAEIGTVFLRANDLTDADDRAREYAQGADAALKLLGTELSDGPQA